MALDDGAALSSEDAFVSLYRRYRPQRFSELRGQEHVVRALRSAVRDGHVAHAYLFSGPRGTGKTSTARILAKALNCLNPDEGDPCGVCSSCVEITRGSSMDVIELDAASNGTIEPVRDLIAGAALGSPGRRKVYIIDEVHMLGTGAANALLKTLEEPPGHVVFVLATTDPQKVPATIRSRTQHLEFRLLGAEVLEGLLRDVRDAAGLELGDDIVSLAVRKGKGSARDALSALDQVAASGETEDARPSLLAEVLDGIAEEDPARSLAALTALREVGWGPQQLTVELVDDLRQAFLLKVAPDLAEVTGEGRGRLIEQGDTLGLPRIVRAIELFGRAQVDMRDAPDPLVIFEVAVVRAARTDADPSAGLEAMADRVSRLERRLAELEGHAKGASQAAPAPAEPIRAIPEGEKPSLGAFRRQARSGAPSPTAAPAQPAPLAEPPPTPAASAPEAPTEPGAPGVSGPSAPATDEAVLDVWTNAVLPGLKPSVRPLFANAPVSVTAGVLRLSVPSEPYQRKCADHLGAVEATLAAHFGPSLRVELVVDAGAKASTSDELGRSASPAPVSEPLDEEIEEIDLDDLVAGPTGPIGAEKILEAFPGAVEEVD
jgi:DNA polymerase-3 subunit gamma/tau